MILLSFFALCVYLENLDLKLSTSKALGKPNDGKTNPEEMFAGGFAGASMLIASLCWSSESMVTDASLSIQL